ncbi:MAG: hypothetical protein ASARMPRED_004104 [Alectoria sarmentosa]|nr:MAG: hypothetical protein ASARMPRED_004104 [Alectoria sarmentosa]
MFNTFRSSGMPHYEVPWPRWITEEMILAVFFCSRGLEVPDVANLIEYKLHRRPRRREGFKSQMDKINLEELRNGRRPLCRNYMADWDIGAVDDFIIRQTDDTDLLRRLLWFGNEHIPLLETYRDIPLNEILHLPSMRHERDRLILQHERVYGIPYPYRRSRFY